MGLRGMRKVSGMTCLLGTMPKFAAALKAKECRPRYRRLRLGRGPDIRLVMLQRRTLFFFHPRVSLEIMVATGSPRGVYGQTTL